MSYECLCGELISVEFPKEIHFEKDDEVFQTILEGEIFRLECSHCGSVYKIEEQALFISKASNFSLQFYPEEMRAQVVTGAVTFPQGVNRVVVGYHELVEKLLLWRDGLDDRVIEYLKYDFYRTAPRKAALFFSGCTETKLEFWIHGLEENKVGKTGLGRSDYDEILGKLDVIKNSAKFRDYLSPPRVCIRDSLWQFDSMG